MTASHCSVLTGGNSANNFAFSVLAIIVGNLIYCMCCKMFVCILGLRTLVIHAKIRIFLLPGNTFYEYSEGVLRSFVGRFCDVGGVVGAKWGGLV